MTRIARNSPRRIEPLYPETRLVKGGLQRLREEQAAAERKLDAARSAAAAVRAAAEKAARAIRRMAYREGLRAGAAAVASMNEALRQFLAERHSMLPREAADLALSAARRIVEVEFETRPEAVVDFVRSTLSQVRFCRDVRIIVAAEDFEILRPFLDRGDSPELAECSDLQWVVQPDAPRGTLRILTNRGMLDSSIDCQFDALAKQLDAVTAASAGSASA